MDSSEDRWKWKEELVQRLLAVENPVTLQEVARLLGNEPDWWDELSEAELAEIEEAEADIAAGRTSTQEEVMERMRARFN